jgi:Cu-Zn family superoxide dismutase
MKRTLLTRAAVALALLSALFVLFLVVPAQASMLRASAALQDASGASVGLVRLTEGRDGSVVVQVTAQNLTPGFHGFHIHTIGLCTPPDFTSAGGHYNPAATNHGHHAGDLPLLLAEEDGTASLTLRTDRFALTDLLDADGSAFIIHSRADNYANIPTDRYDPDPDATTLTTGDAGSRLVCGVIQEITD